MNEPPCRAAYEWLARAIGADDAEQLLMAAFLAGFVLMPLEKKHIDPRDLN